MDGVIIILVIIGFVVVVGVVFSIKQAKKLKETWRKVADLLDLRYLEGSGTFNPGRMTRKKDGFSFTIDTVIEGSGKSQTTYTRYVVVLSEKLNLGLHLSKQGFGNLIGKFFGAQDIEVGDSEFDKHFMIKGNDVDKVIAFLTPERRKELLWTSKALGANVIIDDNGILFREIGKTSDCQSMVNTANRLMKAGVSLQKTSGGKAEKPAKKRVKKKKKPEPEPEMIEESENPPPQLDDISIEQMAIAGAAPEIMEIKCDEAPKPALSEEIIDKKEEVFEEDIATEPVETAIPEQKPAPELQEKPPAPVETDLMIAEFCQELFGDGHSSNSGAESLFAPYEGREVTWTGKLIRANKYYSDFNFQSNTPGVKAEIEILELDAPYGAKRQVKAIVQLPEDQYDDLRKRSGEELTFKGELLKVNALMHEVYVSKGHYR